LYFISSTHNKYIMSWQLGRKAQSIFQ